jgi:hypothetical protein
MSEEITVQENDEDVLYGYRNDKGMMLWSPNASFAQVRANEYGTFQIYLEK